MGYALLNQFRATGRKQWLTDAIQRTVRSIAETPAEHEYWQSLYKGPLGAAILALDLQQPESSFMPIMEDEGW